MKASPLQNDFSTGEIATLASARIDLDRVKKAAKLIENYVPTAQGPLLRRPGTKYVAAVKTSSKATRIVAFEFSTTQAYILEFGDQYVRFYKDQGQITSAGSPYEVSTPYLEADLADLRFTQSADVLYITHKSYAPRKLTRTGHTSWTLSTIAFKDGPYLTQSESNPSSITITPSATVGAITLTASAALFASTDVGRLIRLSISSVWGYVKITAFTDSTHVNATVQEDLGGAGATTGWRWGLWSDTTGYPAVSTFHEDRLFFAGAPNYPQRIDGSCSGDYENFKPTDTTGSATASMAISLTLNSNDVNAVRWLNSDEKGLVAGTVKNEWIIRAASANDALAPTNSITARRQGASGSQNIAPIQLGTGLLFIQRGGRRISELNYYFDVERFRATNLTALAPHITRSPIKGMVLAAYDEQLIAWFWREDGTLVGMTYEHDADVLKAGFHRHELGGYGDATAAPAKVEYAAVIPDSTGTRSEVWLVVKRYINGTTKRYVEFLTPFFDDTIDQLQAFFVDCGLTYDSPKTITNISNANPPVVTSASHGFSNGDEILLDEIDGCQEVTDGEAAEESYFNKKKFTVANVATNTFELQGENSSSLTDYVANGKARKLVTTISGLDHLEGETVAVVGDGAPQADKTVSAGAITIDKAAVVHVGFKYNSNLQLLRFEAGSADGTALGKIRRTNGVGVLVDRTAGIKVGTSFDNLDRMQFRKTNDAMNIGAPLYSGILKQPLEADYDTENEICIRQDQPLPGTILAVMPQMMTQDDG